MILNLDFVLRLLVAGILGAIIGLDREYRAKEAGYRTHFLVSLGSALIMIVSQYGFQDIIKESSVTLDPSRVAAQVVSGISFIGAGTINFQTQIVRGLTTAAGLWATAGIGLAVGRCAGGSGEGVGNGRGCLALLCQRHGDILAGIAVAGDRPADAHALGLHADGDRLRTIHHDEAAVAVRLVEAIGAINDDLVVPQRAVLVQLQLQRVDAVVRARRTCNGRRAALPCKLLHLIAHGGELRVEAFLYLGKAIALVERREGQVHLPERRGDEGQRLAAGGAGDILHLEEAAVGAELHARVIGKLRALVGGDGDLDGVGLALIKALQCGQGVVVRADALPLPPLVGDGAQGVVIDPLALVDEEVNAVAHRAVHEHIAVILRRRAHGQQHLGVGGDVRLALIGKFRLYHKYSAGDVRHREEQLLLELVVGGIINIAPTRPGLEDHS